MNNPTLEERAKRGRRLLGLCLSAVLGILIFVPIFDYVIFRKIGLNQIAAGVGILLVVGAMRGDNVARIVLGILLAVLGLGKGSVVVREVMSGHPSMWMPFVAVVGGIYITAAFILLTVYDIRANEIVKERRRRGEGDWTAVDPDVAPAPPPSSMPAPRSTAGFAEVESTSPPPAAAPAAKAATRPAQQFPLVCTACGRLSPAGAISCKKCGKPFPAIKAARQT